jgi:hypothetical protein
MNKILFEYPQIKSKKEVLDKINDGSMYNDKEKTICLEYLDIWKEVIDEIIKENKPTF